MDSVLLILILITLLAVVGVPILVYRRLRDENKALTDRLLARMEQNMDASVKLLEVRSYYEEMSGQLRKMLDEAYREGNRFRQDHIRRLQERLEQLKARTLDRTVRMLESEPARPPRKRRRRGGRRRHGPGGPPEAQTRPAGSPPPAQNQQQ